MRRLLVALCLLAAGCGSSATAKHPKPTATPIQGFSDARTGVTVRTGKVIVRSNHALAFMTMVNKGKKRFHSDSTIQFRAAAFTEPNTPSSVGLCSADSSRGQPLSYATIEAGQRRSGWIRCDYPAATHVFAIFWFNHQVSRGYRTRPG